MDRAPDHRPTLALLGLVLGGGLLLLALALTGVDLFGSKPPPPPPLEVEAVVPRPGRVAVLPAGARLEPTGFLTVLRAPPTPAVPTPDINPLQAELLPTGPAIDPSIAGGIRAFFRTRPQPQDRGLETVTLEYKSTQLRLVLVDGCLRADRPDGPLLAFPPSSRLLLLDGFLTVGLPGDAPDLRARVGEELFWEAYAQQVSDPASLAEVHRHCGKGAVLAVVPSSAAVFQARSDAAAARDYAREWKVGWAVALREVQACRRRLQANLRRENPQAPEIMVHNLCGSGPTGPPPPPPPR